MGPFSKISKQIGYMFAMRTPENFEAYRPTSRQIPKNGCHFLPKWPLKMGMGFGALPSHPAAISPSPGPVFCIAPDNVGHFVSDIYLFSTYSGCITIMAPLWQLFSSYRVRSHLTWYRTWTINTTLQRSSLSDGQFDVYIFIPLTCRVTNIKVNIAHVTCVLYLHIALSLIST